MNCVDGKEVLHAVSQLALLTLFTPTSNAGRQSIEFFTTYIRNPNTHNTYAGLWPSSPPGAKRPCWQTGFQADKKPNVG